MKRVVLSSATRLGHLAYRCAVCKDDLPITKMHSTGRRKLTTFDAFSQASDAPSKRTATASASSIHRDRTQHVMSCARAMAGPDDDAVSVSSKGSRSSVHSKSSVASRSSVVSRGSVGSKVSVSSRVSMTSRTSTWTKSGPLLSMQQTVVEGQGKTQRRPSESVQPDGRRSSKTSARNSSRKSSTKVGTLSEDSLRMLSAQVCSLFRLSVT